MSWQRSQKTVKHVMAPYTSGGHFGIKQMPVRRGGRALHESKRSSHAHLSGRTTSPEHETRGVAPGGNPPRLAPRDNLPLHRTKAVLFRTIFQVRLGEVQRRTDTQFLAFRSAAIR